MEDAVRPSNEAFSKILYKSIGFWSSHLNAANTTPSVPPSCFDLQGLVKHTPSYLGHGPMSKTDQIILDYTETSYKGESQLHVNGYSSWTTSTGVHCRLEQKKLPLKLLLGTHKPLRVQFMEQTLLLEWPGDANKGNYVGILVLAWAYVLSAKWMDILRGVYGHESHVGFGDADMSSSHQREHIDVDVDLGDDVGDEEEVYWWNAILSFNTGYKVTTYNKGKSYFAPWSISVLDGQYRFRTKPDLTPRNPIESPSSDTALEYLSRFCIYHNLHDESMAALSAALLIPPLEANGKVAFLPVPRKSIDPATPSRPVNPLEDPVLKLKPRLSHYMTLSCNTWGLQSLLCSTFFEPDVECNLVSPWLNPAFEIINPLIGKQEYVTIVNILANRRPRLAPLWLGAVIMGVAKSTLVEIRIGLVAIDYHAVAWTDTIQSFITLTTITMRAGAGKRDAIRREDEFRLLFIAGGDRFACGPLGVWKPFGETRKEDADLEYTANAVMDMSFKYEYWH
jgi:hypothetical protein